MLGQNVIYLGTRHQIGNRVGFTRAKLFKSGQYQKILKLSALFSGIGHFFVFGVELY